MRSPFLLEALEPPPSRESPAELIQELAAVARRLSQRSRRHVERALLRQLADAGVRDRHVLARAVASLRRMLVQAGVTGAEAEALDLVAEELSTPIAEECECGGAHARTESDEVEEGDDAGEAFADEEGEAYEADRSDEA